MNNGDRRNYILNGEEVDLRNSSDVLKPSDSDKSLYIKVLAVMAIIMIASILLTIAFVMHSIKIRKDLDYLEVQASSLSIRVSELENRATSATKSNIEPPTQPTTESPTTREILTPPTDSLEGIEQYIDSLYESPTIPQLPTQPPTQPMTEPEWTPNIQ